MKFGPGGKKSRRARLCDEARNALTRSFPERAEALFTEAEDKSVERYNHLLKLKDLYAPAE